MAAAGVQDGALSSTTALSGVRSAHDPQSYNTHELTTMSKNSSRNGSLRQSSGTTNSRMPLSTMPANRKATTRAADLSAQAGGLSRSGSEADSLIELYKNNNSNTKVNGFEYDNDIPENMYKPDEMNPEGWIHRDKLVKIENEELQAAGINLAKRKSGGGAAVGASATAAAAAAAGGRGPKRDTSRSKRSDAGESGDFSRLPREEKKPRLSEPAVEEEEDPSNWELRSPDETVVDPALNQVYSNPVGKRSGSRIPVLSTSPIPVASEHMDREIGIQKPRTKSNNMSMSDGAIGTTRIQSRKNSAGSQMLLEEIGSSVSPNMSKGTPNSGKSPSSPKVKTNTPTTSPPSTAAERKSTPSSRKNTPKSATSASPPVQKPGTRSGEVDRPRTAVNGPEGDPPWLATMYKPDPMLPPDQQIIPTHARRQQQAQWNDEGAVPVTYDRDFSPLAVSTSGQTVKPTSPEVGSKRSSRIEDSNAWPLKPVPSVRSNENGRPDTSGSITAGYSTMPKIASPPMTVKSPKMGTGSENKNNNQTLSPQTPSRMQTQQAPAVEKDDGTVKKGCGCCIVM